VYQFPPPAADPDQDATEKSPNPVTVVTLNIKSVVTVPIAPPIKSAAAIVIVSPGMYPVPAAVQVTVVIVNCAPVVVIVNCAHVPPLLPTPALPVNEPTAVPTVVDIIC